MFNITPAVEVLACSGAGVGTFWLAWQKLRLFLHPRVLSSAPDSRLLELQSIYGYNEHSFIGSTIPSLTWHDPHGRGAVSYVESGSVWIVGGDPLCSDADLQGVADEFISAARGAKRSVAFIPASERFARVMARPGYRVIKVGASPYFDLNLWDPKGNRAKHLRVGLNQAKKAGISVFAADPSLLRSSSEIADLQAEWISSRKAGVRFGWLFELMPFENSASKRYFVAKDESGALHGILAASPMPARGCWYLEDVLRRPRAPKGTAEALVFRAMKSLAEEGAAYATLGTVPLSEKGTEPISYGRNRLLDKALSFSRGRLRAMYNFDGLGHFKSKFVPTWWENEYVIVSKRRLISPKVANALINIIVPGGLLQILQYVIQGWTDMS